MKEPTLVHEIVSISKLQNSKPPKKQHSDGFAKYGFDYRTAYFMDLDGKYYKLTLSIGINEDGREAYNIGKIEEADIPSQWLKGPKGITTSKKRVPQNEPSVKKKFSNTDSTGRKLSEGQQEYFKDSKVRDENGNLKVMYRGDKENFTVFDKKKTKHSNLYGRGFYFTDSKSHAEQYGDAREFYLDIKNPLSPKQNAITKEQMLNFLKAIENDGEDYDLYNYGQGATAESVLNSVWGKGDFEMLQDVSAGAIGDLVAAVELFNEVNGTNYDGIVLPTETVTFNSEQAKLTSNLNPTKDKDMRFADRDSEGNTLTEAQQEFFKDSKVKDAEGNLLVVYHGTSEDFHTFDFSKAGKNGSQEGYGFYFSDDKRITNHYGDIQKEVYLNITKPLYNSKRTIKKSELVKFVNALIDLDEQTQEIPWQDSFISNYVDTYSQYKTRESAVRAFVDTIWEYNDNDMDLIYEVAYGDGRTYENSTMKDFYDVLTRTIGYDGNIAEWEYSDGKSNVYVTFNPEQSKYIDNKTPTTNTDMRYADRDYSYNELVSKPDAEVITLESVTPLEESKYKSNYDLFAKDMRDIASKKGNPKNTEQKTYLYCKDLGKDILITRQSFKHGAARIDNAYISVCKSISDILNTSIVVNELTEREKTNGAYVLLGLAENKDNYVVVRSIVNKKTWKLEEYEELYAIKKKSIQKRDVGLKAPALHLKSGYGTSPTISIANFLDFVNSQPLGSSVLSLDVAKNLNSQRAFDENVTPHLRYADREDTTVYDLMGEKERLLKENEKFKADVERLKERLALERKITKGNYFNENQLNAVAGHLRKIANSNMDKVELMKSLKEVYSFIAHSEHLTWEDVFERSYRVAEEMLADAKPQKMADDYSKGILNVIRNTRISLSEEQKKEAQSRFDKNWNRYFFNRANITNNGTPIDIQWQEWASQYPDIFSPETNPMDMLEELYDIIGSLKDASETIVEYNAEEEKRWLANEIYNQYWNVSPIRTTADKYDKQIKLLNFEHRRAMKESRDAYESRLADQKKADRAKYTKLANEIRERKDRDVARAKELGRKRLESFKENAERKTVLQSMTSTAMSLNRKLTTNSKDIHIPESLKPVVINLLNAIDFSSKQLLEMSGTKKDMRGTPTKSDIGTENVLSKVHSMETEKASTSSLKRAIQDALELFENAGKVLDGTSDGTVDSSVAALDKDMVDSIKTMIKDLDILIDKGETTLVLQKMSTNHLKTLNGMVKSINHWAIIADKALASKHKKRISDLGMQTVEETDELGSRQEYIGAIESVKNFFNWSNLLPVNAFKRLGDGATEVFDGLRDSQDRVTFNRQEVMDFTAELFKKYKQYKPLGWRTEVKTFDIKIPGEEKATTVSMPVSYIMSLYCVSKQEDAQRHLYGKDATGNKLTYTDEKGNVHDGGGMTIKGFKEGKFSLKVNKSLDNTIVNENIVKQITSVLTKEQIEVADALQEYMNTKGSEWGDSVSMALYGIKKFGVENYFPITVSPHTLNVDKVRDTKASLFSILNYGFTKERNPNAKQSIEIGDIFDVFANHMNMVAIYNAYALSVFDIARWYNFKGKNENGKEISVTASIEKAFGEGATTYVNNLIKDLNGQHESSRLGFISKIFKNTKVAMVGNSLSVALLQPTAYLKAMVKVSPKYLLKSALYIKDFGAKKGVEKAKKYCGIALLKSQGYFETGVSANTTTKMLHDESFGEKAIEWSLKGAGWMDERTWGVLWNACEFEVRATRKDLKVGSEEFYKVIADKLRDVIYESQVVDSPLTKSDLMRSGDTGAKMVTMFASEITVAYNMVFEAAYDTMLDSKRYGKKEALKKNRKNIMMTLTAYTLTSVANALITTAVESFRYGDDDDDENKLLKNFLEDWVIIGKIPYLKELLGFSQGFSSSRTDTLWLESAFKAYEYWGKAIDGKDGATMKAIDESLKSISYASGIAAYNQWRDIRALLRKIGIME